MKKILMNLNYIAIALVILGFTLIQSYGRSNILGLLLLFLGIAAFGFYLFKNHERLKNKNSRLNFLFASNLSVIIFLSIAIIGSVNYLGTKIHKRLDYSEGRIYSISQQSIQVVKNLKSDLTVKAFFATGSSQAERFHQLMQIYRYYSNRIKSEIIDPYKNPSLVEKYEIKVVGTMIFEHEKKNTRAEDLSEEGITNAIIKVTRRMEKTIYFTQGHGEAEIDKRDDFAYGEVKNNLEKMSYKVKKLMLFQESEVPADAAVVVIAGPRSPFTEKELRLLENYIFIRHGRIFMLLDPDQGSELKPLIKRLGIEAEDTVIVEPKDELTIALTGADHFTLYAIPSQMLIPGSEHEIVKNFKLAVLFPRARSLNRLTPLPQNTEISSVLSTGKNTWAATNFQEMMDKQQIIHNNQDRSGPLDVLLAIQVNDGDRRSRAVISGNSRFAANAYYYAQRKANGNVFNNVISWLGEETDLIAIPLKSSGIHTVVLTPGSTKFLFFYCLIILPLLIFIAGISIWLYRRKL